MNRKTRQNRPNWFAGNLTKGYRQNDADTHFPRLARLTALVERVIHFAVKSRR